MASLFSSAREREMLLHAAQKGDRGRDEEEKNEDGWARREADVMAGDQVACLLFPPSPIGKSNSESNSGYISAVGWRRLVP